ncbi:3-oxoacyl-ACP reductase FabG [Sporosarcina sp. P13]|uniref:3-oxoacyl-ACP reductase FabG n=1 Tax=Sporosarcina sp. P13 TaxID=2048263 RepID=UPI000C168642|nr:3-oxoacyl-ACP reductase FabG [Sporosarcina sp. P13]PIC63125.1 3-oxoacyl-ACP reductase FabG [Sporosarcina sp. P13]
MRLKGQTAIITGGAGGIGRATVERFLEEGANVVVADYDHVSGEKFVNEVDEGNGKVIFLPVNVADRDSVQKLIDATLEKYGSIDVLVNNAGITRDAMFSKMTMEQWQEVLNVNLTGVFNCTQAVLPTMVGNGKGKIINTSSISGVYGNIGQTNYAASKSALIGMTKTWAKELGRKGIQVNAVAPGYTSTAMVESIPDQVKEKMISNTSLKRLGKPRDIANAYLFLASDESDYITGHVLHVDGGISS